MAQLNITGEKAPVSAGRRAGVKRMVKHNLKIDMTPMVDLGFLLISFFVITTELSKPTAMKLTMTKDGPPMPLGASDALTFLLNGHNSIYYYEGKWEDAVRSNAVYETSFSGKDGLRKIINIRQQELDKDPARKEKRDGLMMLVKASPEASYKNIVDVLDEVAINDVKKYAVVKLSSEEQEWLKKKQ